MSNLSWKERFARRASGKARDLVPSGSPVVLNLRIDPDAPEVNSIAAIESLVRRHVPLLKAKRAIEAVLSDGSNYLQVPKVEDADALRAELAAAGLTAQVAPVRGRAIDVKSLRERLGKSQEQFAARYRIGLDVLQNWEQHRNEPDPIARNVLEMIERDPVGAEQVLWSREGMDRVHSDLEVACLKIYDEVAKFWLAKSGTYNTWKLGYSILYSPPRRCPVLLTVGENPGASEGQLFSPEEEAKWPSSNLYYDASWSLARKLQNLFGTIGALDQLKDSVGLNVNFFRSRPSSAKLAGLKWRDNPSAVRRELEEFSRCKVLELIRLMRPHVITTLGMKAFDSLVPTSGEVLERRKNSRLCVRGYIDSIPVIGIIHPTGSRVSDTDWDRSHAAPQAVSPPVADWVDLVIVPTQHRSGGLRSRSRPAPGT